MRLASLSPAITPLRARCLVFLAAVVLAACGGSSDSPATLAAGSSAVVSGQSAGSTAFIRLVQIDGVALSNVTALRYTIAAKPGTASRPVSVSYTADALKRRGYVIDGASRLSLPVFGLYAGHSNNVAIQIDFSDSSTKVLLADISTPSYVDPNAIFDRPKFLTKRPVGSPLGFDFFYMKTALGMPVVIDSDGEIRWVGVGTTNGFSSTFDNGGFVVGDQKSTAFRRLELDGTITEGLVVSPTYTNFHHNIDPGKQGLLIEVDALINGEKNIESIVAEMTPSGAVLKEWDFAVLLRDYMISQGDDPSGFIRAGVDWFHVNAATYDARDDSLIVSSRENFVIKVDYQTGKIIWILGDPTKYWHTFPSLRAKAVSLAAGGLYPIGQHATSITSNGLLMLFNDGTSSLNQPVGAPVGASRAYSAVSAYAIDAASLTAREVWRFDHGQTILAEFCSSAHEGKAKSLLVSYSAARNRTANIVTGLDADHKIVFELEYASVGCNTSWNVQIIGLEDLQIK